MRVPNPARARATAKASNPGALGLAHNPPPGRRLYSSQPTPPPTIPATGAAHLPNRRLISLHGPDAPKFLQGILTNNVPPTPPSAPFFTAFLTAPGKVLADAFVYPTFGSSWHKRTAEGDGKGVAGEGDQGFLVEVDGEKVEGLVRHLKKHKLRSKFLLRLVEEGELAVWSRWAEGERWTAHAAGSVLEGLREEGGLGCVDARAPGMGSRVLIRGDGEERGRRLEGCEVVGAGAYDVRRFLRGVPEGQTEIPWDDALPMNYNLDIMGGIDFRKGCYVGQELTIRTHHTGVVRRRVLPVALYGSGGEAPERLEYDGGGSIAAAPEVGTDVRKADKRKRAVGKFIGSVGNVGLAMCRLEQMSDLTVSGEGSSFTPEDKFVVTNAEGKELGVKAFVPDWMRGKIREPKIQKRVE
ncbi:hypothetical protein MBLNU230_g6518t1 [Neophaeotheca triangularis]